MTRAAPRQSIVSIRLAESEQLRLRAMADQSGGTVSEVVRGFVARAIAPPPALGASAAGNTLVWFTSEYRNAIGASTTGRAAVWEDGTVGLQWPAPITF